MAAVVNQPALIELRGIRKCYGGANSGQPEVEILHGIDLTIHAGEFVAIVGASGSGKSTLMHLLGCLDHPSAGTYRFNGRDVAGLDADALAWLRREAFGFIFQGYHLIAAESACENVEVPAIYAGLSEVERRRRATELLTQLGLGDKRDHYPHQLSGGQQQRVSIARALMNGGRIILADEPTGALDSKSGAEVMALLKKLASDGHTVILITHDRGVAAQAERVIEVHDGRIVSDSGAANKAITGSSPRLEDATGSSAQGWFDLREALRSAWRSMSINRLRTGLTLLGIVIGAASVIAMLAIGEGARQHVVEQMGTMGATILYVNSTAPQAGGPGGVLTQDDLDAIAELPEVRAVMPVIGDPLMVRQGNLSREIYVFSASERMPAVHRWKVGAGRYYSDAEDRALAPVAVIGHKLALDLFPKVSPLGRQLLIGNTPFEVIGVMSERGADSGAQNYDAMVYIPYATGRARVYTKQTQPDYVVVDAISAEAALAAEAAITALLKHRHGREDFDIGNAAARIQAEASTRRGMTMMLGLIATVSLVVGGIGVMNVMLMTVRERTREIGIRMATGARQRDIARQFLTEATLLTLVGGSVGVMLGLLIGLVL
ncbi:MAG TPA: ABC transporter permease, partial [Steroidobacter sp.]|nr:ABC transporter permease [Steroidobacter sp.]